MRSLLALGLTLLTCFGAAAENFDSRFEEGYSQMRSGDPDAALASFQALLTEDPESELIQYSIAAALYEKGLKDLATDPTEEAMNSLYEARDGFDALRNSRDPFLKRNAPFNAANSTVQVARHLDPKEKYSERAQALQDAIQAYEAILRMRPEDRDVHTNMNHARYLLKSMMQDPPPDQDQADDSDGGDDGEQGENEEQQEGEEGDQDQEGEEGDQEPQDGDEQDDSDNENPGGEPQDSESEGDPLEDENIEAILQSLEDKNKEEQKNLRKAKGPPKVKGGKWW